MSLFEEIQFCYLAIGPHYIDRLISTNFPTIPSSANVIVMTNTPDLLNDVQVPFNLRVIDIETVRDDFSRQHEVLVKSNNSEEYFKIVDSLPPPIPLASTYKFPLSVHRFGLKWCLDNNIKNVILLDVGVVFHGNTESLINSIDTSKDSFIIHALGVVPQHDIHDESHPIWKEYHQTWNYFEDFMRYKDTLYYRKVMADVLGIDDLNLFKTTGTYSGYLDNRQVIPTYTALFPEGWVLGYLFNDINKLKLYYRMWDELVRYVYIEQRPEYFANKWAVNFEQMLSMINTYFNFYLDTHIYHDNAAFIHLYTHGTDTISTFRE